MSKAYGRGNAAFFCTKTTEHPSPKKRSQRLKRAAKTELIDGIVAGERVKIAKVREPREKGIEIQIRVALAAAGILCWKHNVDFRAAFGRGLGRGVADLICVVPPYGRFLAIEVKRPSTRNRTTAEQRRWIAVVQQFGGVAGVATSVEEAMVLAECARG
jgi:hypothetical protein